MSPGKDETRVCGYMYIYIYIFDKYNEILENVSIIIKKDVTVGLYIKANI